MPSRRPPRLLALRAAAVVVAWATVSPGLIPSVNAVDTGSFLSDGEPCSIPPGLYFRGSSIESGSESNDNSGNTDDPLRSIDCDGRGSTDSMNDDSLGLDCDDEDSGKDSKSGFHPSNSAKHSLTTDQDGRDHHSRLVNVRRYSLDASDSGTGSPSTHDDAKTSAALCGSSVSASAIQSSNDHPQDALDGSIDCEQPLPVPTVDSVPPDLPPSGFSRLGQQDGSVECEEPLPVPTVRSVVPAHTAAGNSKQDGSDDCEEPLPVPTSASNALTRTVSGDGLHGHNRSDDPRLTPAAFHPSSALHSRLDTPSAAPPAVPIVGPAPALTPGRDPPVRPAASSNLFLRMLQPPHCIGDATPVSVEGVEGVFCVPGFYICSSRRHDGACPGVQPGLPSGSWCGIVRTGVYGCRPGLQ